jgi:hypothetical protein
MPIRPENLARYPKDWPAISAAIRERAGHRCEWIERGQRCTACQYAVGHWTKVANAFRRGLTAIEAAPRWVWVPAQGNGAHDLAGQGLRWPGADRWTFAEARQFAAESYEANPDEPKPLVIVLTVAHLNHEPEDCRESNLRAWCQRHHLAYDHEHHQANAQATRRARAGTLELF